MRRSEREKFMDFALKVIDHCVYMTLSAVLPDGTPYCVPLSPVRCGNNLYFHCALEGKKLDALRARPAVYLSFVGNTEIPAGKFTTYYASAAASGTASQVTDPVEQVDALRLLCQKYCPNDMTQFDAMAAASLPRTGVWKISLAHITAKSNFPA